MSAEIQCKSCGRSNTSDDRFCIFCGSPLVSHHTSEKKERDVYTKRFINENIDVINQWLHSDPRIANVRMSVSTERKFGLLVGSTAMSGLVLRYELLDGANEYRYTFHILEDGTFLGKSDGQELLREWERYHPDAIVVDGKYSSNARHNMNDLVFAFVPMASNCKVYFLYKEPRKKAELREQNINRYTQEDNAVEKKAKTAVLLSIGAVVLFGGILALILTNT